MTILNVPPEVQAEWDATLDAYITNLAAAVQEHLDAITEKSWSPWAPFPTQDGSRLRFPAAPTSPGVYELRRRSTGQLVQFGIGRDCADRMRSLAPAPWGKGTRKNTGKRAYVLEHHADIEFRTLPCETREQALAVERTLKVNRDAYVFSERRSLPR